MDEGQREADGHAGGHGGAELGGDREDHEDEHGGEDDLDQEGVTHVDLDHREVAVAIGPEAGHGAGVLGRAREDRPQRERPQQSTGELRDPVADGLGQADAASDQRTDGDGGVDVAAGDRADGIDQAHQDQAEREGGGHDAHGGGPEDPREGKALSEAPRGDATGEEHEEGGAEELGTELATEWHGVS